MIRKYFLSIALILLISTTGFSQYVTFGRAFSFGHAFISEKDVQHKFFFSLTGGFSITYAKRENFGFGADLVYSTEGSKTLYNSGGLTTENKIKLSYIRIPLKAIYFLGDNGDNIRPKVFAGPSFAILVGAESNKENSYETFKKIDAGVHIGIGANKLICDRIWLNTDITYTQGLIDISNENLAGGDNRNGNIRMNISLLLGTNRK
mgnify:CR=1 FL=1